MKFPAALCAIAAIAAIAVAIAAAWHPPLAHADGGASARGQAASPAPDQPPATPQSYAQRILRALADDATNNWIRYWQTRADCDAAPSLADQAAPLDRVLLTLAAAICARLDAHLQVNPDAYSPRGENRTVGLLLNEPDAAPGYTLFIGFVGSDVFLIDPLGRVVHTWRMEDTSFFHARLFDNGNLLIARPGSVSEVDPRGNIVWQYEGLTHHDFLKMPNGNVLLLIQGRVTTEEAIAVGANPEFVPENMFEYDYLAEVRPTSPSEHEVVWKWSTWDHLVQDLDPTKPNYGAIAEHPERIDINFVLEAMGTRRNPRDWLHTDAIDYNPQLDQIMLSPRHFSEIWIIDRSTTTEEARGSAGGNGGMGGDLLYRWGNPRAYDRGTRADQRLFWPHQTHWIPPGLPGAGNILLFNNGNEFEGDRRHYSTIDEITPPVDGYRYRRAENAAYPPDEFAWTYAAATPTDLYSPVWSGAQRLPNGNTLVTNGTAGAIFQVTPDGGTAWKYVSPASRRAHLRQGERLSAFTDNGIYRAYWYPPDYPGLKALNLTPGAFIEDIPDIYDIAHAAAIAGDFGEPVANSDFDIYLGKGKDKHERRLIYLKQPCAAPVSPTRFFLHITPADQRDLPAHRQEYGFDNKDFGFDGMGKASDGVCVAIRALPDYPIESIRTGQLADAGPLWRATINLNE